MATKTTLQIVTDLSRKILAIGAMLLIGGILLYTAINVGIAVKERLYPTPPPPPTVSFGKLPPITFPQQTNLPTFTYTINTISGALPDLGDRAYIHKIVTVQPNLLALQNVEQSLQALNYNNQPVTISDTDYAWTNTDPLPKTLTVNIQTLNFKLTSNYTADPTVLAAANLPDQPTAVTTATDFLKALNALPTDLNDNKTKVTLFAITNGVLIPASSLSQSQILRIDFFQNDVEKIPIYYSQPSSSPMYMLLASSDTADPQIVGAHFFHQPVDNSRATYPIITAKQAVAALQSGNAYIASYTPGVTNVTIRNISLGYYMSDTPQQYLMPIVVLQGDNNFFAYVSAVTDAWIAK